MFCYAFVPYKTIWLTASELYLQFHLTVGFE
jgi:hypothetical protein